RDAGATHLAGGEGDVRVERDSDACPQEAGERDRDDGEEEVDAGDGEEPRRSEAHEGGAVRERDAHLSLALVTVSDRDLLARHVRLGRIDLDTEAQRRGRLDRVGAPADVLGGVTVARRVRREGLERGTRDV